MTTPIDIKLPSSRGRGCGLLGSLLLLVLSISAAHPSQDVFVGRALDPRGNAVAHAKVSVRWPFAESYAIPALPTSLSNERGQFLLNVSGLTVLGLDLADCQHVVVRADGFVSRVASAEKSMREGILDFGDIVLQEARLTRGAVLLDGRPAADALVFWVPLPIDKQVKSAVGPGNIGKAGASLAGPLALPLRGGGLYDSFTRDLLPYWRATPTKADGQFELALPRNQDVQIWAVARESSFFASEVLPSGAEPTFQRLEIFSVPKEHLIRGCVRNGDTPGRAVIRFSSDSGWDDFVSDADGQFSCVVADPAKVVTVQVFPIVDGFTSQIYETVRGGARLDVALERLVETVVTLECKDAGLLCDELVDLVLVSPADVVIPNSVFPLVAEGRFGGMFPGLDAIAGVGGPVAYGLSVRAARTGSSLKLALPNDRPLKVVLRPRRSGVMHELLLHGDRAVGEECVLSH